MAVREAEVAAFDNTTATLHPSLRAAAIAGDTTTSPGPACTSAAATAALQNVAQDAVPATAHEVAQDAAPGTVHEVAR